MTPPNGSEPPATTDATCLDASTLLKASTQGWRKDVRLSAAPRPLLHVRNQSPSRPDLIPSDARALLKAVTTGQAPWPILMHGPVGTGKTCAALCVLDRCLFSRRYFTAQKMCEDAAAALCHELYDGAGYAMSTIAFWMAWSRADIACLDEIGSRSSRDKVSDHHYETVKRAIDERRGEPSIWISNLDPDGLAKVYDDRIASRLSEGTIIMFAGADRRVQS